MRVTPWFVWLNHHRMQGKDTTFQDLALPLTLNGYRQIKKFKIVYSTPVVKSFLLCAAYGMADPSQWR
jgi:hypothetical protein